MCFKLCFRVTCSGSHSALESIDLGTDVWTTQNPKTPKPQNPVNHENFGILKILKLFYLKFYYYI